MLVQLLRKYSNRFLSKWVVLLYDLGVVAITYILATLIWHNFVLESIYAHFSLNRLIAVLLVYTLAFHLFQTYSAILRFTGLADAFRIVKAAIFSMVFLFSAALIAESNSILLEIFPPKSLVVIHFLLALWALVGSRYIIRSVYNSIVKRARKKNLNVIIYGAGAAGLLTRDALLKDKYINYQIVCFIDDNQSKIKKRLDGIPVLAPQNALSEKFISQNDIHQLIISIIDLDLDRKKSIIDKGLDLGLQVKEVPPINNWINGKINASQLRDVPIEEILGRDPIKLDNKAIINDLAGKVVMVTGAAGSIGSEICRQCLLYSVSKLILLDQAESALFELQFEISSSKLYNKHAEKASYIIADVKDKERMEKVFMQYAPDIIFHAAAYKHVPLMEAHPYEALRVNVQGTRLLADLSLEYGVAKFVMISTDKAVNPTSVMGASKRIAEMYIQQLSNSQTQFITTRFGNVLGSNGSVIPIFKKQIAKGGPITITHKDIIRYFMTIPEACNLVLEAGAMGAGGEVFVFDMGEPVKIYDLAKKMIQLSGLKAGKDVEIVEIGLRPGEKLFEELLTDKENNLPTHHPKIRKASTRHYDFIKLVFILNELQFLLREADDFKLVKKMKELVPEFKSNNSVFEKLDLEKTNGSSVGEKVKVTTGK